jgi:hypothetical protein
METKDLSNMTFAEERAFNQDILDKALTWSEGHPMKAMLIASATEAIARVNRQEANALRIKRNQESDRAFAALPWYKKLFRSA